MFTPFQHKNLPKAQLYTAIDRLVKQTANAKPPKMM